MGLLASLVYMMGVAEAVPRLGPGSYPDAPFPAPLVSVIVPARNEEARIGDLLRSLLGQAYPALEIIVVDDRSTDRTAEVVREISGNDDRVRLINGEGLAKGWLGKPHAIWQGTRYARGTYLCFIDADGRLHPQCIRQAVACSEAYGADLLTIGMRLECPSFWERAIQPLIVQMILMWFPADKVNDPHSEAASANGPFLLFRRQAYDAIGGHASIRNEIVDDLVLAQKIKKTGHRLVWALAPELMEIRMYQGFKDIWEGWSKNFYKSMGERLWLALVAAVGIAWFFVLPWALALLSLGWLIMRGWDTLLFSLLAICLATLMVAKIIRRWMSMVYKIPDRGLVFQPLGALVVIGILFNSTVRTRLGKGVRWKGRVYPGGTSS